MDQEMLLWSLLFIWLLLWPLWPSGDWLGWDVDGEDDVESILLFLAHSQQAWGFLRKQKYTNDKVLEGEIWKGLRESSGPNPHCIAKESKATEEQWLPPVRKAAGGRAKLDPKHLDASQLDHVRCWWACHSIMPAVWGLLYHTLSTHHAHSSSG